MLRSLNPTYTEIAETIGIDGVQEGLFGSRVIVAFQHQRTTRNFSYFLPITLQPYNALERLQGALMYPSSLRTYGTLSLSSLVARSPLGRPDNMTIMLRYYLICHKYPKPTLW